MVEREHSDIKKALKRTITASGLALGVALGTTSPVVADSSPKPEVTSTNTSTGQNEQDLTVYTLIALGSMTTYTIFLAGYIAHDILEDRKLEKKTITREKSKSS